MPAAIEKQSMKIFLFMPISVERKISFFIEGGVLHRRPILCTDFESLTRIYDKDIPSIIITTYWRGTDKKVHDKMLRLAGIHKANLIIVSHDFDRHDITWYIRLEKAIMFFDDLHRPLCSVVTVGINIDDYLGIPHYHGCEDGECVVSEKLIGDYEKIKYGFIYKYKFKKNGVVSYARIYKSKKRNHVCVEPDMKITTGNRVPYDSISREEIDLFTLLSQEVWQF
jgi:hypothetical protein